MQICPHPSGPLAVRPVVTKTFKLAEAASAQRYLEQQHPRGKVVLEI
jgi:NADPH:quinone reductase-like Zn-dependent oxidoreductase